MRILVIDDYVNFEIALRDILEGHTVSGVRGPDMLPKVLAEEGPFDQAIVDLRFLGSVSTGLTALARLRELSPATRAIVTTTEEENRLLYLLAAFRFFAPKALLAKRAAPFPHPRHRRSRRSRRARAQPRCGPVPRRRGHASVTA